MYTCKDGERWGQRETDRAPSTMGKAGVRVRRWFASAFHELGAREVGVHARVRGRLPACNRTRNHLPTRTSINLFDHRLEPLAQHLIDRTVDWVVELSGVEFRRDGDIRAQEKSQSQEKSQAILADWGPSLPLCRTSAMGRAQVTLGEAYGRRGRGGVKRARVAQ